MSIVLKAFPLSFLISPDSNDSRILANHWDLSIERNNLELIKVATNIRLEQVNYLMENLGIPYKYKSGTYYLNNGLSIRWDVYNSHMCAHLTVNKNIPLAARIQSSADYLVRQGEILMRTFEVMLKKNIRDIKSKEIFYYCYKTPYRARYQVMQQLKEHGIENITKLTDMEIKFRYNNKNYKFIRNYRFDNFYLESEQKISLVNIIAGEKSITSRTLVTNYTNKDILIKTLKEYGATFVEDMGLNVSCELSGMQFFYSKDNANSSFNLEINRITEEDKCTEVLRNLDSEYALNIQDLTYRKILERIKDKNMRLESESVENDNTIVLTIDVG